MMVKAHLGLRISKLGHGEGRPGCAVFPKWIDKQNPSLGNHPETNLGNTLWGPWPRRGQGGRRLGSGGSSHPSMAGPALTRPARRCVVLKLASLGMFSFSLGQTVLCLGRNRTSCESHGYDACDYQVAGAPAGPSLWASPRLSALLPRSPPGSSPGLTFAGGGCGGGGVPYLGTPPGGAVCTTRLSAGWQPWGSVFHA